MTKSLLPWSLKGVSLEARARAKAAASEAGEPLGKWLGDTIRQIAEAEAAKVEREVVAAAAPREPALRDPAMAVDLSSMVARRVPVEPPTLFASAEIHASAPEEDAASAAGDLAIPNAPPLPVAPDRASAAPPSPEPSTANIAKEGPSASGAPDDWRTAFAELARRLDETERRMTANVAPLQASVERLVTRLDRHQPPRRVWRLPTFLQFRSGR
jgi:hypothetical protein